MKTRTSTISELPHDVALPGLAVAAPDRMLEILRDSPSFAPANERETWQSCTMMEAIYQPGRACRIAYALGPDGANERQDLLYARWDPQTRQHESAVQLWGEGHGFEVYRYPRDRRMRQIRSMRRDTWLRRASETWFRQAWGEGRFADEGWRCTPIKYVPESRLVCRLKGHWTGAGDDKWARAYVRISRRNDAEQHHRALIRIRDALAAGGAAVTTPSPLGCMPNRHLLATEFVRGRSLKELAQNGSADDVVATVGKLASLYGCRPDLEGQESAFGTDRTQDMLRDLSYGGHDRADACRELDSWSEQRPPQPLSTGLVHGDLHCGQIIHRGDRVCVVDWERAALGDGTQDILNLALELSEASWLQTDYPDSGIDLASACVEAWRSAGGPWNENAVRWWAVRSLVLRAWGLMRHLRPQWPSSARHLLDRAVQVWNCGLGFVES